MNNWFISDTHFSHRNIIKYENRPFSSVENMNEQMIKRWNNAIEKNDDVYILGDFAFVKTEEQLAKIVNKLNGNIHLIRGNHDYYSDKYWAKKYFTSISNYKEIKIDGFTICMFHYPIAVWNKKHHGSIHLYGHVHSNKDGHHPLILELGKNAINVGVDVWDYRPVNWKDIKEIID
jgi:calcineurin-like phosphoesterase family protein